MLNGTTEIRGTIGKISGAHSRLRQLFIGSTTLELMRSCTVPVLIFP